MSSRVRLFVTGDVFPDLEDGRSAFRHLGSLFGTADIVFGGLEGVYSDRPSLAPSRLIYGGAPRERGAMLGEVPFHVMTCATNHMVDGGYEGLADTLALLHEQGIEATGAGMNIGEATRPAVLERDGLRVAFLGFCSVFPVGYEAREERPGIAPLRIQTFYSNPFPNMWDPGVEPTITTIPLPEDIERFQQAIDSARRRADVVVVACHWGYAAEVRSRLSPATKTHERHWLDRLQDYETTLARQAVGYGADIVVCHHQATLRGVEIHQGKPIFYGLGNFAHHFHAYATHTRSDHTIITRSEWNTEERPLLPFTLNEPWNTGVAVFDLGLDGTIECGFIPAKILVDGSTEPLRFTDPRATEVNDHLIRLTREVGFDTTFEAVDRDGWMMLRINPNTENQEAAVGAPVAEAA